MTTRSHTSPADVLELLATGDKTEAQIFRKLKITKTQWLGLRAKLIAADVIATVGRGENKQYMLIDMEAVKWTTLHNGW